MTIPLQGVTNLYSVIHHEDIFRMICKDISNCEVKFDTSVHNPVPSKSKVKEVPTQAYN